MPSHKTIFKLNLMPFGAAAEKLCVVAVGIIERFSDIFFCRRSNLTVTFSRPNFSAFRTGRKFADA